MSLGVNITAQAQDAALAVFSSVGSFLYALISPELHSLHSPHQQPLFVSVNVIQHPRNPPIRYLAISTRPVHVRQLSTWNTHSNRNANPIITFETSQNGEEMMFLMPSKSLEGVGIKSISSQSPRC